MGRKKRRTSTTRRLHRTLGASVAVFILFMVFSGMAINHAESLDLDRKHVTQPFLLEWYGVGEPGQIRSYRAGGNWVTFADTRVYLNGKDVSTLSNGLGAVFNGELLVVAGENEIILIDPEGPLVDRIPWEQPDSGVIESIGLLENGMVVVNSGTGIWVADSLLLQWRLLDDMNATAAWSEPERETAEMRQAVIQNFRGTGLSMERLLLDFHSGRVFGPLGVLLYDLLALIVGFLAVSGTILWIRGRNNGKNKQPKN